MDLFKVALLEQFALREGRVLPLRLLLETVSARGLLGSEKFLVGHVKHIPGNDSRDRCSACYDSVKKNLC